MPKFSGIVGFGQQVEVRNGVFELQITERTYFGDVVRNVQDMTEREQVLPDMTVSASISILADAYANENLFALRYIKWAGSLWEVASVTPQRPRLLLRLGGPYHGPTA